MDVILVINAGSSSIKFHAFAANGAQLDPIAGGKIEEIYTNPRFTVKRQNGEVIEDKRWPSGERLGHDNAIAFLFDWLRGHAGDAKLLGVGHRVVHGGDNYSAPVRIDAHVMEALDALIPLAPLHQPHNLAAIRSILSRNPHVPQIACFDTAFHHTQPAVATRFALPPEITSKGVRRYGFHGLSYEYIASVLPHYDERAAKGKTVVLHLGNGASMTAFDHCRSIASTMGFTAVEGLVMGTRSGSLDPGVVLWMLEEAHMDARAIESLLYKRSGPCLAFPAFPAICAHCSPAMNRALPRPSNCSATASRASSAHSRQRLAAWMRSYSPLVSANMRQPCAIACARLRRGSACRSMRRRTRVMVRASATTTAQSMCGSSRPTKN